MTITIITPSSYGTGQHPGVWQGLFGAAAVPMQEGRVRAHSVSSRAVKGLLEPVVSKQQALRCDEHAHNICSTMNAACGPPTCTRGTQLHAARPKPVSGCVVTS